MIHTITFSYILFYIVLPHNVTICIFNYRVSILRALSEAHEDMPTHDVSD